MRCSRPKLANNFYKPTMAISVGYVSNDLMVAQILSNICLTADCSPLIKPLNLINNFKILEYMY